MIDALSKTISNEADKLLRASQGDTPMSENQISSLEALCRCARALKATEREEPDDDFEEESEAELLATVGNLPTGGSPGCAGS